VLVREPDQLGFERAHLQLAFGVRGIRSPSASRSATRTGVIVIEVRAPNAYRPPRIVVNWRARQDSSARMP
jgi:hypothetical protein